MPKRAQPAARPQGFVPTNNSVLAGRQGVAESESCLTTEDRSARMEVLRSERAESPLPRVAFPPDLEKEPSMSRPKNSLSRRTFLTSTVPAAGRGGGAGAAGNLLRADSAPAPGNPSRVERSASAWWAADSAAASPGFNIPTASSRRSATCKPTAATTL